MDKLAVFICQFWKIGFHDPIFHDFFVSFDLNVYHYDNVDCLNKKESISRLSMHFWKKIWVSVLHVLPKNIALAMSFGPVLFYLFTSSHSHDII